jgi:hypothetical protein
MCCDHCAPTTETVGELKKDVAMIREDVTEIKVSVGAMSAILTRLEPEVVTQKEYAPVRRGFYGIVGAILLAVILGGLSTVWPWVVAR